MAASTALVEGHDDPADDLEISSVPNGLVLYNPVIDTSENGYGFDRLGECWRDISPTHSVRAGLPPTIVFHGDADVTVPCSNATEFAEKMKAAGNDCTLVTLPGVGHGFAYNLAREAGNQATRETDGFLAKLGYLAGEATLRAAAP